MTCPVRREGPGTPKSSEELCSFLSEQVGEFKPLSRCFDLLNIKILWGGMSSGGIHLEPNKCSHPLT